MKNLEDHVARLSNHDCDVLQNLPESDVNSFENNVKAPEIDDLNGTCSFVRSDSMEQEDDQQSNTVKHSETPLNADSEAVSNIDSENTKMAIVESDETHTGVDLSVKDDVAANDSSFLPLPVLRQQVIGTLCTL